MFRTTIQRFNLNLSNTSAIVNRTRSSQINKALFATDSQKTVNPEYELDDLYKKVVVEVRGHDSSVLNSYEEFVKTTAAELELNLKEVRTPFRFIERWSILKSRFSNRKHMRQYEMRTHFKEFEFVHLTGSTCSVLLEYIQRNLPTGVAMHVHQTKITPLPGDFQHHQNQQE